MFNPNSLAKYSIAQIEGIVKQRKKQRSKYWILVIIFSTLLSVFAALSIISVSLYATNYHDDFVKYLSIVSSVFFGVSLILFLTFIVLNYQETVIINKINAYLKTRRK